MSNTITVNYVEFALSTIARAALQKLERSVLPLECCTLDPTVRPTVLWSMIDHVVGKNYCPENIEEFSTMVVEEYFARFNNGMASIKEAEVFEDRNIFECSIEQLPETIMARVFKAEEKPEGFERSSEMDDLINDLFYRVTRELTDIARKLQ